MNAATRFSSSLVAAFAVLGFVAGCATQPATTEQSAPSPSTTASPSPVKPTEQPGPVPPAQQKPIVQVPTVTAGLETQRPAAVPPVRMQIQELGIDMPVEPVGLTESGDMALFENPSNAGWYRYGAWPGSGSGSTVIAAHVDSVQWGLGPMAELSKVKPGMEIVVTLADNSQVFYNVDDSGLVLKTEVPWESVFDRSGASNLTIVTCGGDIDWDRMSYESNTIVTALPRP